MHKIVHFRAFIDLFSINAGHNNPNPIKMSLNFGTLGKVLFQPKEAFEGIKEQTTMQDGILMYVILAVIGGILGAVINLAAFGSMMMPMQGAVGVIGVVMAMIIGIIFGIVGLLILGWLSSKLAHSIGHGTANMDKTVGFLGYAEIVNLVIGLIISIMAIMFVGSVVSGVGNAPVAIGAIGAGGMMVMLVGLVGFIWALYVSGSAVSVANEVSLAAGIASYFLAILIIAGILILVGILIGGLFLASFMGGMGIAGV